MNKKAEFKRLVGIMILIVVLIIMMVTYFTPKGLLSRVSNMVADWSDKILSGLMGQGTETKISRTFAGESMTIVFYDLATKFLEASNYETKKEKCIIDFSVLPLDFQDHKIKVQELEDNLFFELIDPEGQTLGQVTIENIDLCVVYGSTHVPKFYSAWINDGATKAPSNEYRDVNSPAKLVFEKGTSFSCEECGSLEDVEFKIKLPLLYKPKEDHVCLISTKVSWGDCSEYSTVIDSKCEEKIKSNIPYCN